MTRATFVVLTLLLSLGLAKAAGVPVFFVQHGDTRYVTQTPELAASFSEKEIVLKLRGGTVRVRFPGSKRRPTLEPGKALSGHVNFLLGRDPAMWETNL